MTKLTQETEREAGLAERAYVAERELGDLRKRYALLERDRNALLQAFRETGRAVPPMTSSDPTEAAKE